ncbi:hypothetical protein LCGC14_2166220, partial [marine sediment metagenome]
MVKRLSLRKKNLKRSKLIFIFILSVLLLSPSVSSALVGPAHAVEVKAGESYNWHLKFNISNYIELLTNTGGPISTELLALSLVGDSDGLITLTAKFEILYIPDDFAHDSFFDLTFTIVEGEFTLSQDYNISTIPIFYPLNFSINPTLTKTNFSILKGDTPNYFTAHKGNAYPKGTYHGFFFIIPTDLGWATAAAELQTEILAHFRRNYGITDVSVLPQSNGLRISTPSDTTILATELSLNYNSKGVLETASGKYGGAMLFSLALTSDGTIAFELP